MSTTLYAPPQQIAQNTSLAWRFEDSEFAPADGWAVAWTFEGPANFTVSGNVDGAGFLVQLAPGGTNKPVGMYAWQAFASRTTPTAERVLVGSGRTQFVTDLEASTATTDGSTHSRRMVALLQAVLEGTATATQKAQQINGRSLERWSFAELMAALRVYEARVAAEDAAAASGSTLGRPRPVRVVF